MNMLNKWLSQPVVITFASGMSAAIHGKLVEVDEHWLTVERENHVITVVGLTFIAHVSLDPK